LSIPAECFLEHLGELEPRRLELSGRGLEAIRQPILRTIDRSGNAVQFQRVIIAESKTVPRKLSRGRFDLDYTAGALAMVARLSAGT